MLNLCARVLAGLDKLTDWTGRAVAWLTVVMALLVATVVVMRYFLQIGSVAMQESITYLHGVIFMLGIAFTLQRGGHVRVDIFYREFTPRRQAIVDLIGAVLFLIPVAVLIFVLSWDYVAASWAQGETSTESTGLAYRYLLKSLLLAMPATLLLQGIAEILRNLLFLTGKSGVHSAEHGEGNL